MSPEELLARILQGPHTTGAGLFWLDVDAATDEDGREYLHLTVDPDVGPTSVYSIEIREIG